MSTIGNEYFGNEYRKALKIKNNYFYFFVSIKM